MKSETSDREEYDHPTSPTLEEEASDAFVRRLSGDWTADDQLSLESRLQRDAGYGDAFRRVEESWSLLDELAETSAGLKYREEATRVARQVSAPRRLTPRPFAGQGWRLAAALVGVALLGIILWQLSPFEYKPNQQGRTQPGPDQFGPNQHGPNPYREYRTGIGEQRTVELADHSRIMLDAVTRIRVRFSDDSRLVQLEEGQAEFHVAKDRTRPFKVQVDGETITDLGTVFNVNRTEGQVDITVIEGRIGVAHKDASPSATTVPPQNEGTLQLSAGEELRVSPDGLSKLIPHADLGSLTAWREGLVIFRDEPLSQAVRRFNRYSSLQIEIQGDALAAEHIGGVFKAGDTHGFIRAIELYQPVAADYSRRGVVVLKAASATPR